MAALESAESDGTLVRSTGKMHTQGLKPLVIGGRERAKAKALAYLETKTNRAVVRRSVSADSKLGFDAI